MSRIQVDILMEQNEASLEEWIILKKKHLDNDNASTSASLLSNNFFTTKFQRTKHNLSKLSNPFRQSNSSTDLEIDSSQFFLRNANYNFHNVRLILLTRPVTA